MGILGIGGSTHDFSACLVRDGKIIIAIEDERITRRKHSLDLGLAAMRCKAVDYCYDYSDIGEKETELIVGNDIIDPKYYYKFRDSIVLINHHLSHACSTFYVSPYEEAAILVVDGRGSIINNDTLMTETMTYYHGRGTNISEIKKIIGKINLNPTIIENSIGRFYWRLGDEIGFKFTEEGKTMGLAPYGTPLFVKDFYRFYSMNEEGIFKQSIQQKRQMIQFIRELLIKLKDEKLLFQIKADIAFAGQFHIENILVKAAQFLYKKTKSKNLCLAGGVALNSVGNYKILENTPFENIFIQPAAGDAGTSIGSALYGHYIIKNNKRTSVVERFSPYCGHSWDNSDITKVLKEYSDQIHVFKPSDLYSYVAKLLSEGKIIGWFQGRSEIGPRALGNRSILADARKEKMKDIINERIKHRELFRPFAPIILEEKQLEYFQLNHPSYYMLLVSPIRNEKRHSIQSVTHIDGTGRVQTVSKSLNPHLYNLLFAFYELTGTPVLLNTSFNDNGEPIVESPLDALKCFLNIDLDYLVIGEYVVQKIDGDVVFEFPSYNS